MLKKRLLSLFVAITLVLTASLPSATFATNNETQQEEVVDEVLEEVPEEKVDEGEKEETIHCVDCDSENVSILIPLLNLYHCEDCGKYFTISSDTNKKSISDQVSAVEEDAKKEANETLFGINDKITVSFVIFQNGSTRGSKSYSYAEKNTAKYPEINDEEVFGEITTEFPGWIFKGYATSATGNVLYRPGDAVVAKKVFTVYEKQKFDVNVYRNYSSDDDEIIDSKEVVYGEAYTYTEGNPEREGYKFLGWSEDREAENGDIDNLDIELVERNVDYYAIWRQELGVKYPGLDVEIYELGDTVILKDTFEEKTGYTLEGWAEKEGTTEVEYELGFTIDGIDRPYELYPVYLPVDCDITVEGNIDTVKYDSTYTLPETAEEKEGYTFVGFTCEGEGYEDKYDKGESFTVKGNASFTPIYEANTIEVKFITNGEVYKIVNAKYDAKLEKPEDPVVEHYTFDGWFTDEECSESYDFAQIIKASEGFNIYAKLDIDKFDVTFDTDGGNVIDKVTLSYGDKVEKPTDPEKKGHTFSNWVLDGVDYVFDAIVEKSFTLKAVYTANKYEVKVGDNEATLEEYGSEYTLPETYEVSDVTKKFAGFKDQDGKEYDPGEKFIVPDKVMTFVVMTNDKEKYTVRFFDGDIEYTGMRVKDVIEETAITAPDAPEKKGHTFAGWYVDKSFSSVFDFANVIIKDTNVYAKFDINKYEVKVGDNEATLEEYGSEYTLPETYEISDNTKKFVGFKDQDGKKYNPGEKFTVPDEMVTFEIVTADKERYTVKFFDGTNEYTEKRITDVLEGDKVVAPTAPTKVGHTFVNWFEDNKLTKTFNFDNVIVKNINIYAKYDINVNNVTVGDNAPTAQQFGTIYTLPTDYNVNDRSKELSGFKDQHGNEYAPGASFEMPDEDLRFEVITKNKAKYEVHFFDGNVEYDDLALLEVYKGETIELPTVSKTDYIFKYWCTDNTLKNEFENANTIGKTMNLYAKFTPITYTVKFDSDEGTKVAEQQIEKNSVATKPVDPTKPGYTFVEWQLGGTKYNFATKVIKEITLKAVWKKAIYTISLNNNNGIGGTTTIYEWHSKGLYSNSDCTTSITKITAPTRTGYTFGGYVANSNGTGTEYIKADGTINTTNFKNNTFTSAKTIYAKWTANVYTVTLNTNNGSGGTTAIYEKYATGLYSNSNCTTSITKITAPTRTGYTFGGYVANSNGTGTEYIKADGTINTTNFKSNTFTSTKTIYAKWTINTYTIKYNAQGGSISPTSFTKTYGKNVSLASPATRDNYRFDGWYKESGCINRYDGSTDLTTTNGGTYTIYAKWVRRYTVITYYLNKVVNGTYYYSWNTRSFDENASYTKPSGVINNNTVYHYLTENGQEVAEQEYTFKGFTTTDEVNGTWYSGEYNSGTSMSNYNEGFKITGDVTLYATYSAKYTFVGSLQLGMSKGYGSNQTALTHAKRDGYTSSSNLQVSKGPTKKSDDKDQYAVYIGYKKTTNPNHAIKDVFAEKYGSAHHDNQLVKDGHDYYRAITPNSADMRRGHGGDYQYLFYTKDAAMGKPIKTTDFKMTTSTSGTVAKWWYKGSSNANIGAKKGSTWNHYLKLR